MNKGIFGNLVGTAGFEPATLCSQSRCASQAALRPDLDLEFATLSESFEPVKFLENDPNLTAAPEFLYTFYRGPGLRECEPRINPQNKEVSDVSPPMAGPPAKKRIKNSFSRAIQDVRAGIC